MMVGRWVSFWDCLFLGAMLNFRGVDLKKKPAISMSQSQRSTLSVLQGLFRLGPPDRWQLLLWFGGLIQFDGSKRTFFVQSVGGGRNPAHQLAMVKKPPSFPGFLKKMPGGFFRISEASTIGSMGYLPGFTIKTSSNKPFCVPNTRLMNPMGPRAICEALQRWSVSNKKFTRCELHQPLTPRTMENEDIAFATAVMPKGF